MNGTLLFDFYIKFISFYLYLSVYSYKVYTNWDYFYPVFYVHSSYSAENIRQN